MMCASRSITRDATNLLTATPDEAALFIACALLTARGLLSLRLSCRRFNIRCIAVAGGGRGGASRGSGGDAVHRGGCGAVPAVAVGGALQRVGAWVGAAAQW